MKTAYDFPTFDRFQGPRSDWSMKSVYVQVTGEFSSLLSHQQD